MKTPIYLLRSVCWENKVIKKNVKFFWEQQEITKVVATSITTIGVQWETRYGKVVYIRVTRAINLNVNNIM
jgi:hypothetical protein